MHSPRIGSSPRSVNTDVVWPLRSTVENTAASRASGRLRGLRDPTNELSRIPRWFLPVRRSSKQTEILRSKMPRVLRRGRCTRQSLRARMLPPLLFSNLLVITAFGEWKQIFLNPLDTQGRTSFCILGLYDPIDSYTDGPSYWLSLRPMLLQKVLAHPKGRVIVGGINPNMLTFYVG